MIWRIILGTVSLVLTTMLLGYVAVTESDRMQSFSVAYEKRSIENGAALFWDRCIACHGDKGQGIPGVGPALNAVDLFDGSRMSALGWQGTVEEYVRGAITSGRPRASSAFAEYPNRMPAWGQNYGGPLRGDQVESLVAYVMHFRENYVDASGNVVSSSGATAAVENPVGIDFTQALPAGDPVRGEELSKQIGCVACHITAPVGPPWLATADAAGKGVGTHAAERLSASDYTGAATSPEQYLFESIVLPNAYLVPGNPAYVVASTGNSVMPAIYSTQFELQDVADIIAYLLTLK